jgi:YD repeat-containing protein
MEQPLVSAVAPFNSAHDVFPGECTANTSGLRFRRSPRDGIFDGGRIPSLIRTGLVMLILAALFSGVIGLATVALSSVAGILSAGALGPVTVTFNPADHWNDSGYSIPIGQSVNFSATGTVGGMEGTGGPQGEGTGSCDTELANGPMDAPALSCWSLIGRFGTSGTPFEIGTSAVVPSGGGELYLEANDNYYSDNTGGWTVTIAAGAGLMGTAIAGSLASRYAPNCHSGDPVNCASGDYYDTVTDVDVLGYGPSLSLTRTYNSLEASTESMFGYGWSSSYGANLVVNSDSSVTVTEADGSQVTAAPVGSGAFSVPSWADSTLVENTGGTYTFVRQGSTTYNFSSSGQLTSIADASGATATLAYTSGKLQTVTDPSGRTLTFAYGSNGLVSSVTDPLSRITCPESSFLDTEA